MAFKKGHSYRGGRPKGTKNGEGKNSSVRMNNYPYQAKQWERHTLYKTYDIEDVDYYIYNDLDITELMDEKKLPAYSWKGGNDENRKQYNLNSKMKAKRDREENGE